jgi:GAF domain-containing protein/HAMP domain-containing protein
MTDQPAGSLPPPARQEKFLAAALKQFIQLGVIALAATIAVYAWLYYQQRAWQTAIVIGGQVLGLLCLLLAGRSLRRTSAGPRRLADVTRWILLAVWLAFISSELAWQGLTVYNTAGGLVLIILIGTAVNLRRVGVTRRPPEWVTLAVLFAAAVLLIHRVYPLQRYDLSGSTLIRFYIPVTTALLGAVGLYYFMRSALMSNLRYRLIVAFSLLVTLPLLAIGVMSIILNAQRTQENYISKLESVANLKEAELEAWIETLRFTLFVGLPPDDQFEQVRTLAYAENPLEMPFTRMSYDNIREQYKAIIADSAAFDEMFLLDREGLVLLSTDQSHEKMNDSAEPFFRTAAGRYVVSSPYYSNRLKKLTIVAATPVKDVRGNTIGILAGRANLDRLNTTMLERAGLGNTGETYLLDKDGLLLTESRFPGYTAGVARVDSPTLLEALRTAQDGSGVYVSYRGVRQIGVYRWVAVLQTMLVAEQSQQEALTETRQQLLIYLTIIPLALLAAVAAALTITRSVTGPLASLVGTTTQIASGNLDLQVPVDREDEIGALARAFDTMAARLRELIGGLEQRVAERTHDLERRTRQMRASAEVARDITQVNLSEGEGLEGLLNRAVTLISERFGYYHAGIFLLDDRGEYAVLRAASGETGRQMLARGHKLGVHGESREGLVGFVADTGAPRISLDVGADAVHFRNPLLPNTRSEMALPLHVANRIIGVLDVQSTEEAAFSQDDITALQSMADQLAVAIENARLVQQSSQAVAEMEKAFGRYTRQSWLDFLRRSEGAIGVRYQHTDIVPTTTLRAEAAAALREGRTVISKPEPGKNPAEESGVIALAVPLKLRDQVLGVVNLRYKAAEISRETVQLIEAAANRLALVLENTRLLEESRRRAAQEVAVRETSTRLRETLDVETVLRTAVEELYSVLGLEFVELSLADGSGDPSQPETEAALAGGKDAQESGL